MDGLFKQISKIPQLKHFYYNEDFEENLSFPAKNNLVQRFEKLASTNFKNLTKLNLNFSTSLLVEFPLNSIAQAITDMKNIEQINVNIFEYTEFSPVEEAVVNLLSCFQQLGTLKELFFSIDGEVNLKFSEQIIDLLTKCRQITSLGNFSLRVDHELMVTLFKKIYKMKNLEKLLLWFSPLNNSLESCFTLYKEGIFLSIKEAVNILKRLENLHLRFPVSNTINYEMATLRKHLSSNPNLSIEIDTLPIEVEDFF